MALPSTNDTQKVFQSALEKLKPFSGGVAKVSNTPHMTEIYENMAKLFETFTNGALSEQGANSTIVLNQICKSINQDFLNIVKDSDCVDKLVTALKKKQEQVGKNPEKTPASATTKKVATGDLDFSDVDINSVVLDFVDELQTAILQVRLNLNREYEWKKLQQQKSIEGQQEDIDKLTEGLVNQNDENSDNLETLTEEQEEWKEESLEKVQELADKFNGIDNGTKELKEIDHMIKTDRNLHALSKPQKFDIKTFVSQMKSLFPKPENAKQMSVGVGGEGGNVKTLVKAKLVKMKDSDISPEKQKGLTNNITKMAEVPKQQKDAGGLKVGKNSPLNPTTMIQNAIGGGKAGKGDKGGKLKVSPDGTCTCPICGTKHLPGQHQHKGDAKGGQQPQKKKPQMLKPLAPKAQPDESKEDPKNRKDLNSKKVNETLATIHGNLARLLKNKKFRNAYSLNYKPIQKAVGKRMNKIGDDENQTQGLLDKTKKGIKELKKPKGTGLFGMLFGGIGNILVTVLGALILISLARIGLRKWRETYMPRTDPNAEQTTIFGIPIPNWEQMKAIGIGIWNFFNVGLVNWYDRIKLFFGNIHKSLFGKKGAFKNMIQTRNTLRKILGALIMGIVKKIAGFLVSIVLSVLNFIAPGAPAIVEFLIKLIPAVITFIGTQIMLAWSNSKAD